MLKIEAVKRFFFSCFQTDLKYRIISAHLQILISSVQTPNNKRFPISLISLTALYTLEVIVPELIFFTDGPNLGRILPSDLYGLVTIITYGKKLISLFGNAFLKDGLWPDMSLIHDLITY